MRRSWILPSIALLAASCGLLKLGGSSQPAPAAGPVRTPSGPKPSWIDRTSFHDAGTGNQVILYGVGSAEVDQPKPGTCWDDTLMLQKADGRARSELAKLLKVDVKQQEVKDDQSEKKTEETSSQATLERTSVESGWFDGDKTVYVLAKTTRDKTRLGFELDPATAHTPTGGLPPLQLKDAVRAAARAAVDCEDPYKRKDLPCCGPLKTFCSDKTRFDQSFAGGVCKCGSEDPCLFDYKCMAKAGSSKCVCQGPKCPCSILTCRPGLTCGDGRCY